jgi:hypothetical protein
MHSVGRAKYVLKTQDGVKTHQDGSKFWDIDIFKNKRKLNKAISELKKQGYTQRP